MYLGGGERTVLTKNKTLIKDIKDNTNRGKGLLCLWIEELIFFKNHAIKGNPHIQCNSYENTRAFSTELKQTILNFVWKDERP